ncbi:MAG: hypothetical protein ACI3ZD_03325 [Prevotella sp.]
MKKQRSAAEGKANEERCCAKGKRVMRLVSSYPEEALWEPVFRVWHLAWRGING